MRRLSALTALFLALLLPLQAVAFSATCGVATAAQAVQHCPGHHHDPLPASGHHDCGAGCCMALTNAPTLCLPGRAPAVTAALPPPLAAQPARLSDRLDRPPRA